MQSTVELLVKFKEKLLSPDISEEKKIKVLSSLSQIAITSAHLGDSGIGRVVAKLKYSSNFLLSSAAKSLVNTWKSIVEQEVLSNTTDNSKNTKNEILSPEKSSSSKVNGKKVKKMSSEGNSKTFQDQKQHDVNKEKSLSNHPKSSSKSNNSPEKCTTSNRSLFDQFKTYPPKEKNLSPSTSNIKNEDFLSKQSDNDDNLHKPVKQKPSTSKLSDEPEVGGVDNTCGLSFAACLGGLDPVGKSKKVHLKSPANSPQKRKSDTSLLKMPTKLKKLELTREDILSDVADSVKSRVQFIPSVKNSQQFNVKNELEDDTYGSLKITTGIQIYKGKSRAARADGNQLVPSLEQLCIRVLIQNIDLLDYVGGVPYMILQPVLEVCSPDQLEKLEKWNPIFLEDSDELWQKHVERKYRGSVRPRPGQTWRELFTKRQQEEDDKFNKLTKSLTSSMQSTQEKRRTIGWIPDAKPPRDVRKRQERYKTGHQQMSSSLMAASDPLVKLGGHTRHFPQPKLAAYSRDRSFDSMPSTSASRSSDGTKKFSKSSKNAPLMKKIMRQIKKDNFRPYC